MQNIICPSFYDGGKFPVDSLYFLRVIEYIASYKDKYTKKDLPEF